MAYQSYYTITDWQNLPSQKTALNRTNLLHVENGVKEADNRIVQLDAKKTDLSVANTLVKSVVLDADTGILTVTLLNGTSTTYDLDIEKVVTNFDITDDNQLVLTLADGTKKSIDLTRFVYSVASTATIAMQISNRVMTATIVDGSVTMEKLDAAIQTQFRQYMLDAQAARDAALQYQKYAKRYAIGDEDFAGSKTDNAKYYYEQAKANADTSTSAANTATQQATIATEQATIATQKATSATVSANSASASAAEAGTSAATANSAATIATTKATEANASAISAAASEQIATDNATLSKRYAVGGVVPEDVEDNAEWYYEQTKNLNAQVQAVADLMVPQFYIDFTTGQLMSDLAATGMNFWIQDGQFYGEVV